MSAATQNPTNVNQNTTTNETTPEVDVVAVFFDAEAAIQEVAQNWGWVMFAGVASVIAGICALIVPGFTTAWVGRTWTFIRQMRAISITISRWLTRRVSSRKRDMFPTILE